MRMTNQEIEKLLANCDELQRRTQYAEGCMHTSARCFDACMRAFDTDKAPANWIAFKIFLAAPVMQYGEARIYRNGHMEMSITHN